MDFLKINNKWQNRWFDEKIFEPKIDEKEKFFFTIPYPYVSGALHVGHGRTYANGDVIARFKRMQGYNVLWPMGFHITGTPVLAISSKIKEKDQKTIELYNNYVGIFETDEKKISEIVQSFTDPWNVVNYFSSKLVNDFKNIGFSLDLSRQFTTGDLEYNKFIEWQFQKYFERGYLKKAGYPILYCSKDQNAVGEDDISGGDEQKTQVQEFTTIKFKLVGTDKYLVSATLRPDTFYGITNMYVNPQATYVVINLDSQNLVVSKETLQKLKLQGRKFEIKEEIPGEEFVAKLLETPDGRKIPTLPATFVDPAQGTGFVHSVPSHAPFDHVAIEDVKKNKKLLEKYPNLETLVNGIDYIAVIECEGFGENPAVEIVQKYKINNTKESGKLKKAMQEVYKKEHYSGKLINSGEFTGLKVSEAKEKMSDWVVENNYGFVLYEPSAKVHCRCGEKICVAILNDQWFLDFNSGSWKEDSKECLSKMVIHPDTYRKQFEDVFDWLDKRPCARKRGLGTKFPFNKEWIIESLSDSTIYMAFYTIIKKIREFGLKPEDLTLEFFDYVFLGKGEGNNDWKKIREEFLYWYPNDLRHTAIAHITNHLSFMIFAHTAVFNKEHWPGGFSLNEMLISEGKKMSKSKGNVVMLNHIAKELGADAFRLYIVSTADFASLLDFRKKDAKTAKRNLERFYNFVRKMIEIGESIDFDAPPEPTHLTKWITSVFEKGVNDATNALENFRIRDYVQISFYKMLNNFEYFYSKSTDMEKASVYNLISKWILLLCPVIPHTCEELWEFSENQSKFASLEGWPKAQMSKVDEKIIATENYLKTILEDVTRIKRLVKIKPTKLRLIVASNEKVEKLKTEIKKETPEEVNYFEDNLNYLKKNFYSIKDSFSDLDEVKILKSGSEFISSQINLEVVIELESESKHEKAKKAFPNKPAIVLEE